MSAEREDARTRAYRLRARRLAERTPVAIATDTVPVLVVILGTERYAVPLKDLAEVIPYSGCTPVPGAPASVCGVVNVRGEFKAVIDPSLPLGLSTSEAPDRGYVVMLREMDGSAGLRVDGIDKVDDIDPGTLRVLAASDAASGPRPAAHAGAIRGITPGGMLVLDVKDLLAGIRRLE